MGLTDAVKSHIDAMSYESMLERWRNAPIGSSLFQGASGEYFAKRMKDLRSMPGGDTAHVVASKRIGWEGQKGAE